MNPVTDSLQFDHASASDGTSRPWSVEFESPAAHGRPPSRETVIALIRRRAPDPLPLVALCRSLDKPARVVLPVLRAIPGAVCVPGEGWRVEG